MTEQEQLAKNLEEDITKEYAKAGIRLGAGGVSVTIEGCGVGYDPTRDNAKRREK
jgi:hypothetical protein